MNMSFIEERELLEELLQSEQVPYLLALVLILIDARLGMERLDKGIHHTLVIGLLHPRLQLLRLQNRITSSRTLEYIMHHLHQLRLLILVFEVMYHEVLHVLTLLVQTLIDADRPLVDQFQDAGRKEVVVVGTNILIGILHIVSPLEIPVLGDITIPEQVLHHLSPCSPYIIEIACQHQEGKEEEE